MSPGREPFTRALITLVLCLGITVGSNGLTINNCPANIDANRSNKVYWSPPTITNNVGGYTLIATHDSGRYYFQDTTVTYTAEDDVDIETCEFNITIQENGSPVITSCPDDMTATAPRGSTSVSVSWTNPTVEDSANVNFSPDKAPGSQFDLGRNVVTYTFAFTNNAADPQSFCSFDIFVDGGGSSSTPTLACPDDIIITLDVGEESKQVTWDDPSYPNDLGSVTTVCARNKNDQFFQGRNNINCVGYFENGAAETCHFYVQVNANEDGQDPSIVNCPSNIQEFVAPGDAGKVISWTEPTITDNNQQDLDLVATHTNNIFYNVGSYTVVYTGTDVSNNMVQCSFIIVIENDDSAPLFDNCLSFTEYVPAGETSAAVSWPEITAFDNADDNVEIVGPMGMTNGETLNVGDERMVTYMATDNFGNTQTCQFTVSLEVDQVPVYSGCTMDTTTQTDPGVSYTVVTWPEPSVTDDLSEGRLILTKSYEPGMQFEIGVYLVEYTATDERQNVGTCSFVLTIEDQEPPTLGTCPTSMTYSLTSQSQTSVEVPWTNPTATDNSCNAQSNCDTAITVTSSRNPGLFIAGDHPVTITATDMASNTASCTFTITVQEYVPDTDSPVWMNCPSSYASATDPGQPTKSYDWAEPTVTDNFGVVFQSSSHTPPFNFPIGMTTVTYLARDAALNEDTCTFTVEVTDEEAPVWAPNTRCGRSLTYYLPSSGSLTLPLSLLRPVATDNSGIPPTYANSLTDQAVYTFTTDQLSRQFEFTAMDSAGYISPTCIVTVMIAVESDPWELTGSITFTQIGGFAGIIPANDAGARLGELRDDMDILFRMSDVGSHFVEVRVSTYGSTGGNPSVTFQFFFSRMSEGRHTSRQIEEAFYRAIGSSRSFGNNNVVLAGSLDFQVREFKMTSTIIRMRTTNNPTFLSQYDDPASADYKDLEDRLNAGMDAAFRVFFSGYQVSVLIDLRDGSIINDVVLVFDGTSQATEAQIVARFNALLGTDNQLGNTELYFNDVPTSDNQELCPSDECQNGGSCSYDATYTNMCTCAEGFTGDNCENGSPSINLSPLALAGIIGGGILLLLLLFALCCCCLYFCREPVGPYKDPRYLERPFQIVDDEESVVSSVDVFMMPRERMYRESMPLALPPPPPVLALEPPPPREAPTLRLDDDYFGMEEEMYGLRNDAFAMDMYSPDGYPSDPYSRDMYPRDAPSFSPDGEVYVTGPNQVAIRPSTKRSQYYRY